MEEARRQANIRLIQRVCKIQNVDIKATATHSVLYEFINNSWTKCQMEGSLFLVSYNDNNNDNNNSNTNTNNNRYALIILNRTSTDNFILHVTDTLQIQHQDPFLILKTKNKVLGIWFHNANERIHMDNILQNTVQQQIIKNNTSTTTNTTTTSTATATAPNIIKPRSTSAPANPSATTNTATIDTNLATMSLKNALGIGIDSTFETTTTTEDIIITSPTTTTTTTTNDATTTTTTNHITAATTTATTTAASSDQQQQHNSNNTNALDKKSLQLALLSLIQDDRFLDLIHSQYLKVVRTRAKKQQSNSNNQQQNNNNNQQQQQK